ncbi:MAG: XdhC family protein, partial [Caulobacteraceae bacterium]
MSDDARPALRAAADARAPAALATIVGLDGGGPRPVGTQMVVSAGGVSGFLSGGCLEADVAGHAAEVLRTGAPHRLIYGEGSPWPDIRLMCGARIEIVLERIAPDEAAVAILLALTDARRPAWWTSDGRRRGCVQADAAAKVSSGAYGKLHEPVTRLIVLGADPTALAIAMLGAQAGCETTLVRPKGPAEPPPLPGVAYSRDTPASALAQIGVDRWTAVAVATHEAQADHDALLAALPSR